MPIFGRDSTQPPPVSDPASAMGSATADRSKKLTHVAAGSKISGILSGTTEVLIDGEVEGEVNLEGRVILGRQGRMLGDILGRWVQIAGKVVGNIHGLERVELLASATLEGNVMAPRVVIAEGAFFNGKVEMKGNGAKSMASPKPEVPRSLVASEAAVSQPKIRNPSKDLGPGRK